MTVAKLKYPFHTARFQIAYYIRFMTVDYIIVGQGICGTFLSWNLLKKGKSVLVIDDEANPYSSSKVVIWGN